MKSVSISGSPRANVGKKDATALRNEKKVPCVLYGGKEQIHFSAPETEFKSLLYTPDVNTVNIDIAGKKFHAIVQEAQYHALNDSLLHVDFLEIIPGRPVVMNIPVRTTGTSPGVRNGGKLNKKLKTLRIKGPVEKMLDAVVIPVDKMEIGDSVRVGDLKFDGLTLLNAPNVTVVSVQVTRIVEEEAPVAAVAAPVAGAPAAGAAAPAAPGAAPAAPGAVAKPAAAPAKK